MFVHAIFVISDLLLDQYTYYSVWECQILNLFGFDSISSKTGRVMHSTVLYRGGVAPVPPANLIVPYYLIWKNPQWTDVVASLP